jgi:hypothetical protein
MQGISIHQVLSQMAEGGDKPFEIVYVKSQGRERGDLRRMICYYGAPMRRLSESESGKVRETRKARMTHLESGTIPLTDAQSNELRTPRISHIIEFNSQKVIH